MPDIFDTSMSHYAVCDRPDLVARAEHLRRASVRLQQADDIARLGYLRDQTLAEAADHLRAAGADALAARVEALIERGGIGDLAAIDAAVREMER